MYNELLFVLESGAVGGRGNRRIVEGIGYGIRIRFEPRRRYLG